MGVACVSCAAELPPDARFCSTCGAAQVQTCPACGVEQAARAAFCSACGAALRTGAERARPADEHEERRLVTALFADLAGSTVLGEQIDPEELRTIQGELYSLVDAEVTRFGGVTEKFVGDAVVAVFGVPHAHDDDAERAVRAALEVQRRFPLFAAQVLDRHGVETGLRIGVNTGEVVAGREAAARGELMVTGDALNVAARLQQRADPGQVLVGERTQAVTRRAIRYASAGTSAAKGKEAPVPAWVATAVIALPGSRGVEGLAAPMIGRDDELHVLRALTDRVERDRTPQLVTLFGNAGVGKTRLLAEYADLLPEARVLQGRCLPYGDGVTYWPLAELAKGFAGILDSEPADSAMEKLDLALRRLLPLDQAASVVEAVAWTIGLRLPENEAFDVQERLVDAWRRFLSALGMERLTIVAIEDVHWASEPLLDVLEQLTAQRDDTAVLTVCTARPEFLDVRKTWGGGLRDTTSIRLLPLPADESAELVEALAGSDGFPDDVTARIVARAEGNPFYVEEILQMLIDRGAIAPTNGSWTVLATLGEIDLPDSVHGVIAARIDLLDAASREALRRCSVMGRVFWPAAVDADDDQIAALARRGLVSEQRGSAVEGVREFAFKHALTHDVAYATLPHVERRELHRRIGSWFEQTAPDRASETAELAAYHYYCAVDYGDASPEVRHRAFELSLSAGNSALARAAVSSAERLLRRALEFADEPRERCRSEIQLGRAHVAAAQFEHAHERFQRAARQAESTGDEPLLAEALGWLSRSGWLTGRWEEALAAATAAVDALAGAEETPQLARALARRSQIAMLRGLPEAEEQALEAIDVSLRVGDEHGEVNARTNLAVALSNRGIAPEAAEVRRNVEHALAIGDVEEAYRAAANFLWAAQGYLPLPALEQALGEVRALLADVPPVEAFDVYLELSRAALVDVHAGRWEAVDRTLAGVDTTRFQAGADMLRLELTGGMALRRGDLAGAAAPLGELRALALASGEPQRILPMACVVLPHAVLSGDAGSVREVAEAFLSSTNREWATLATTGVARALAAAGETSLLHRAAEALRLQSRRATTPRLTIGMAVAEGLDALARQQPAEAVELLRVATEAERRQGWAYRCACLELDLARALEAAGSGDDAAAARARAGAVLGPLGCVNAY